MSQVHQAFNQMDINLTGRSYRPTVIGLVDPPLGHYEVLNPSKSPKAKTLAMIGNPTISTLLPASEYRKAARVSKCEAASVINSNITRTQTVIGSAAASYPALIK